MNDPFNEGVIGIEFGVSVSRYFETPGGDIRHGSIGIAPDSHVSREVGDQLVQLLAFLQFHLFLLEHQDHRVERFSEGSYLVPGGHREDLLSQRIVPKPSHMVREPQQRTGQMCHGQPYDDNRQENSSENDGCAICLQGLDRRVCFGQWEMGDKNPIDAPKPLERANPLNPSTVDIFKAPLESFEGFVEAKVLPNGNILENS